MRTAIGGAVWESAPQAVAANVHKRDQTGAALCAAYGARGMPSWLWIVVGILGLQHGAGLLGIAAFANLRLKRPARALAAIALGFAGIAWWTGIDRAWTWALDGTAWIAVAAIAALLPATPGQLRLIRHWIALAGARRRQSMKIPQAS